MKFTFLVFTIFINSTISFTQNLIINPGFDTPIIQNSKKFDPMNWQFHCKHWYVPTESTVDLFCDSLKSPCGITKFHTINAWKYNLMKCGFLFSCEIMSIAPCEIAVFEIQMNENFGNTIYK